MVLSFMGGPPDWVKWKISFIEKGALKAGRDPSEIEVWVRGVIIVAESKEAARREAAGFVPFGIHHLERHRKHPEVANLIQRLEREQPGIIDEMRRYRDAFDNEWFENIDAPHARLVTQRMIDNVSLTGTVDDICEGIYKLAQVDVKGIGTATYTIIDKKGMLREIGDKIMPRFRN